MLRRLFRLPEPTTAHEAFGNMLRPASWMVGLLFVAGGVGIAVDPWLPISCPPAEAVPCSNWPWIIYVTLFIPPVVAAVAATQECVVGLKLSQREARLRPRTGNPLLDYPIQSSVVTLLAFLVFGVAFAISPINYDLTFRAVTVIGLSVFSIVAIVVVWLILLRR